MWTSYLIVLTLMGVLGLLFWFQLRPHVSGDRLKRLMIVALVFLTGAAVGVVDQGTPHRWFVFGVAAGITYAVVFALRHRLGSLNKQ